MEEKIYELEERKMKEKKCSREESEATKENWPKNL